MSPTIQMAPAAYTPTSDAMDRHEYGITKRYHQYSHHSHHQTYQQPQQQQQQQQSQSTSSTGGGRAWSDDEEVYLLQTRLQKMPYKHIAAHLKKTELACRLHYHQLSHGSNRRKRTTSVSSGSSSNTTSHSHSPPVQPAVPSPIHELPMPQSMPQSRTPSPPASSYSSMSSGGVQLPAILTNMNMTTPSPRMLPAILPKPALSMALSPSASPATVTVSVTAPAHPHPHSAPLLPAATFTSSSEKENPPSLRLDCSGLPAPSVLASAGPHAVDMPRLHAVYAAHRSSFWSAVAADYGHGASPAVLEQAWRGFAANTNAPLTPGTSPDDRELYYNVYKTQQSQTLGQNLQDKTRISAILGIDANPRSPKEREMVRRLEEERV